MRSCALFNCKSIIVSNDNAPDVTATMAKAGSGALETVNYISVVNLSRAIIKFKKRIKILKTKEEFKKKDQRKNISIYLKVITNSRNLI